MGIGRANAQHNPWNVLSRHEWCILRFMSTGNPFVNKYSNVLFYVGCNYFYLSIRAPTPRAVSLNRGFTKPPLQLEHGLVVTARSLIWM